MAWTKHNSSADAIFRTLDGGKTWREIPWLAEYQNLIDISITDSDNIWIATEEVICHTSDAVQNWEVQYQGDSVRTYVDYIEMFDSMDGIAECESDSENVPVIILKTNDGGETWASQNSSYLVNRRISDYWRGIDFVSPNIGHGIFYYFNVPLDTVYLQKTTDGGKT